ncbi:tRNA (adenosine(37)-N6)-threonylcarbamoyltransferase complex ATPase subunit type 1 TsaE [Arachnia propionica]|uniref:tRNA threonylcarbamoyladenosine biosynthesis protein TsaE n=1 Tax=Arachnia propionica TaxID=1750 RepID=A0A3P1TB72_9ACTN|nr:tRNA (adenosine(37)-N6)-threonylcarbamoyltransferase complex ATPase subunit type 1 TsaE [Arachnia propionica]RRD06687.1 tRNA (adenosine(37)-N6)-threonylcarbamoyltransferase complex ATPase subunit type 1 TsaE [Arachnia propionica]
MSETIQVRVATDADAPAMRQVAHTAFAARRPVDPPAAALTDTVEDYRRALSQGWGVCALDGDRIIGCLLIAHDGEVARLCRVAVLPEATGGGVAKHLVAGAVSLAADAGLSRVELACRREFPELADWWRAHGFATLRQEGHEWILGRDLPVVIDVPSAEEMQDLGARLAGVLRAGDVVIATGDLGAGKTTLTQGIGRGLQVAGPIISPTFVISRIHPAHGDGPDLVHVDAYRMSSAGELADIDLDQTMSGAVTLIEWGEGVAEWLSENRLEIDIDRSCDPRRVTLTGVGPRWAGALEALRRS